MSEARRWANNIVGHGEVDPRTLVAHPENPKIHPPEQDVVVDGSLKQLGWVKSVQVNTTTGHVLDGHDRIKLAIAHGEAMVPVEYVCIPEEDEATALITLDASVGLAQPDVGKWQALAARARQQTREPALLGLWAQMAAQHRMEREPVAEAGAEEDAAAGAVVERGTVLQAQWETALGDVWELGPHRVWCGDCTTPEAWDLVRAQAGQVQGCITSPPYAEQRTKQYGGIPAPDYVAWFRPVARHIQTALRDDGSFFLNLKEHSEGIRRPVYVHALLVALVEEDGWEYLDEFVWDRPGVPGDPVERGKFKNMWEPVFWLAKQVRPVFHPERVRQWSTHAIVDTNWQPGLDSEQGTGRNMLRDERKGPGWAYPGNRLPSFGVAPALGHAGAFPVGLPQWFVEVYSDVGDWWVEPFVGSGSTLVACENTGRKCWGMDASPASIAITLQRFQDATGVAPVLGARGRVGVGGEKNESSYRS